jgi:hypothetical protein
MQVESAMQPEPGMSLSEKLQLKLGLGLTVHESSDDEEVEEGKQGKRKRAISEDEYESDFIDDSEINDDLTEQEAYKFTKTKQSGFFVQTGEVEVVPLSRPGSSSFAEPAALKKRQRSAGAAKKSRADAGPGRSAKTPPPRPSDSAAAAGATAADATPSSDLDSTQLSPSVEWRPHPTALAAVEELKIAYRSWAINNKVTKAFPRALDPVLLKAHRAVCIVEPAGARCDGYIAALTEFLPLSATLTRHNLTRVVTTAAAAEARVELDAQRSAFAAMVAARVAHMSATAAAAAAAAPAPAAAPTLSDAVKVSEDSSSSTSAFVWDVELRSALYETVRLFETWVTAENEHRAAMLTADREKAGVEGSMQLKPMTEKKRLIEELAALWPEGCGVDTPAVRAAVLVITVSQW